MISDDESNVEVSISYEVSSETNEASMTDNAPAKLMELLHSSEAHNERDFQTLDHVDAFNQNNFTYGEKLRVSEEDFYPAKGVYRQESNELYSDRAEIVSESSSLKPSETAFSLPQEPEMFVPQNKNGNSTPYVSSERLKQQISNGSLNQQMLSGRMRSQVSNQSLNQKMLHGSLRPQISNNLTPHVSNTLSDRFISIPGMPSYLNENLRSQLLHQSSHQGMSNGSLRPPSLISAR